MPAPPWLSLLAPLPHDVVPQCKPVASAQQLANGTAGPIAGWQSIMVNLSEPDFGLRHIQITLDEQGRLLAGGDHVMFVRETTPEGGEATVTDHESIGGARSRACRVHGRCRLFEADDQRTERGRRHA